MALLLNEGWRYGIQTNFMKGWTGSYNTMTQGRTPTSGQVFVIGTSIGSPGQGALGRLFPTWTGQVGIISTAVSLTANGAGDVFTLNTQTGGGGVGVQLRFDGNVLSLWYGTNLSSLGAGAGRTQILNLGAFANQIYFMEMKVDWATGRIILRIDGSVYYDGIQTLGVAGTTLSLSLRATYFNTGFGSIGYMDTVVMDASGTEFNDFIGDVICETLFSTGPGAATEWTLGGAGLPIAANFRQRFSGVTLLGFASGLGWGHRFRVGDNIVVTGFADASFNGTFTVATVPNQSTLTYANPGADSSAAAAGTVTKTPIANWQAVNDLNGHDSDSTYVSALVAPSTDTYEMEDLASPAASPVLLARAVLVARKETAAIMAVNNVVRSGGTFYEPGPATDLPNTMLFMVHSVTMLVDPATGSAWTRAAVNALEVGARKTA